MRPRIFMIGYSTDKGGVESYIRNICSELNDDFEIILNWPVMNIDGKEWRAPATRHNPIAYRSFWKRFFNNIHFDAVYFNTCDIVSIDCLKFAKAAGIPVRIIHSHNTGNQTKQHGLIGIIHQWQECRSRKNLHKYATDLLACSESAGDWMFDGRPYTVIKNGIALDRYNYSHKKAASVEAVLKKASHPVIACLGRLDAQKNPFFSMEIFKAICEINKEAQCLFIGDGEHRNALEQMVIKENLNDRIIFTGAVDNVNEWLSHIDCILMPSLFEGLPFALVEAQAAGIHSLVSDTVSEESNITGLVKFESLDKPAKEWAMKALELSALPRMNLSEKLTEAGFSIKHSAQTVSKIIKAALNI